MEITAVEVENVFKNCLFTDNEVDTFGKEELMKSAILAEGVKTSCGFHPERLESNRDKICEMLMCLDPTFRISVGGGWSFLNGCIDSKGQQWGEHKNLEQLILLGIAIDRVSFSMPREGWLALPGGVPYFTINDKDLN